MNWKGWIGAHCLACGLGMEGYAQEPLHAVKVGYTYGYDRFRHHTISLNYERSVLPRFAAYFDLGGGYGGLGLVGGTEPHLATVRIGTGVKWFFAIRRNFRLSGLFLGPAFLIDRHRISWNPVGNPKYFKETQVIPKAGFGAGYQHLANQRLLIALECKFIYARHVYFWWETEAVIKTPVQKQVLGFLYSPSIQIGYAF